MPKKKNTRLEKIKTFVSLDASHVGLANYNSAFYIFDKEILDDLLGRGVSEPVDKKYDATFFPTQFKEILMPEGYRARHLLWMPCEIQF